MKKTLALSIVLLAAISCNKELTLTSSVEEHPLVPMTFTADIEDTKAFLEGIKSYWVTGDQISVCKCIESDGYTDAPVLTATKDGATTTFTGTAPAGLTKYFAAYPAAKISQWSRAAGTTKDTAKGSIKSTQVAKKISKTGEVDNYLDPEVMYLIGSAGTDLNFNLKHVLAYIKFTIPEGMTKKIKTVTLSSGYMDGETWVDGKNMSGSFNMQWVTNYWNIGLNGTGKKITIKNDTDSNLEPGNYYIAFFPRASSTTNYPRITLDFYNYFGGEGNVHVYKTVEGGESGFKLAGGTVYNVGTVPVDLFY